MKQNTSLSRIFDRIVIDDRGCWLYQGGINSRGYGVVSVKGKSKGTHKVAFELRCGKIPKGKCVLHRCDVRHCINPDHLFLGTLGENNTDRKRKGRNANRRGEQNTQAKLTAKDVAAIRHLATTGRFSHQAIGKMFGIGQQQTSSIISGRAWPHIETSPGLAADTHSETVVPADSTQPLEQPKGEPSIRAA